MDISYVWDVDFPKGYGHTSISYLKKCAGYEQAKAGDYNAAKRVVHKCVKRNRIDLIRRLYPSAVLLPVVTSNALPIALAAVIGLPVNTSVKKACQIQRKTLSAMERLMTRPAFQGHVPMNVAFIIVDDIVTQGGTICELRRYVMSHGSFVVAVVALAYSIGSTFIAPKVDSPEKIESKFGIDVMLLLRRCNIADDLFEMTNSQIRYLLRFKTYENIAVKMEQSKIKQLSLSYSVTLPSLLLA